MSGLGTKQTFPLTRLTSAFDPKRTSFASQSNDHQKAKPREDAPLIVVSASAGALTLSLTDCANRKK
jgi:hypothetical protein